MSEMTSINFERLLKLQGIYFSKLQSINKQGTTYHSFHGGIDNKKIRGYFNYDSSDEFYKLDNALIEEIPKAKTLREIEELYDITVRYSKSQRLVIEKWDKLLIENFKLSKTLEQKRNLLKSALKLKKITSEFSEVPTPIKDLISEQIIALLSIVNNSKKTIKDGDIDDGKK